MISFGAGVLSLITIGIISLIFEDWSLVFKVSGTIGLVACLISALLSGVFISGDRVRGNWTHEDNKDKNIRQGWGSKLFLFGFPNIVGAIAYTFWIQ